MTPLELDGGYGEGGGQILRTALALAVAQCRAPGPHPRRTPTAGAPAPAPHGRTGALAAVSAAEVSGEILGSTELTFVPHDLRPGEYHFDVGAVRAARGR